MQIKVSLKHMSVLMDKRLLLYKEFLLKAHVNNDYLFVIFFSS